MVKTVSAATTLPGQAGQYAMQHVTTIQVHGSASEPQNRIDLGALKQWTLGVVTI